MFNFKEKTVLVIVFLVGAVNLIIEVVAFRLLSPVFGNTIFTTSSVIGTILLALSIGYYLGGILGDKKPKFSILFLLVFFGGFLSVILFAFAKPILWFLGQGLNIKTGPIVASLILFLFPSLLLGMISPFAIKLKSLYSEKIGKISGSVFFWGTLGSLAGNFLTGFVLVPFFGVSKILLSSGLFLAALGFIGWLITRENKSKLSKLKISIFVLSLIFLLMFGIIIIASESLAQNVVFQKEGLYAKISVIKHMYKERPGMFLLLDNAYESGIFLDSQDLPFDYTKYYSFYNLTNPNPKKAFFLGGGAYTLPKKILQEEPNIEEVDIAEIDPALFDIAREYFQLPNDPRLKNNIIDGRYFLKNVDYKYDTVFMDAFDAFTIPNHLFTKEFFFIAKSKLTNSGTFIINVVASLSEKKSLFLHSAIKTFKTSFPSSYIFAIQGLEEESSQNFIFLGFADDNFKLDFKTPFISKNADPLIREAESHLYQISERELSTAYIFTDDFAPIDYLNERAL